LNKWLWFHILGGGILTKLFLIWFTAQTSVLLVLLVAVLWEVYEALKDDVEKIYGTKKRFYKDALQDIAGALIMSLVVVL
jgi:hypothetical protein